MRKLPSFSMGATPSKFQIEFLFHKLELMLSNPSAKISLILRVGTQKVESSNKFKALKEINLQETSLNISTLLYENKSGLFQEKTAQIDICLTNSKLTNSIGIIKLNLANYANNLSGLNFEKSEYLQMQRSVEYQGKVLFTVKGTLIERNVKCIDDYNKRDYSEIGSTNKRSMTPTPTNSARGKFLNVSNNLLAEKKITQMMRNSSRSPIRKKTQDLVEKKSVENEQITLEKMLKTLKLEKENKENEMKMKTVELNEREKNLQDLSVRVKALEKENEELNNENDKILEELNKNKDFLQQQQKTKNTDEEIKEEKKTEANFKENEEKFLENEKNNEKILMEKLELQIVLQMLKKKKEENLRNLQNLKQTLQQKEQEIDVLNKMYTDLNAEFDKIAAKDDRSPLVPTNDLEDCDRKCKILAEKNASKQKELQEIKDNINHHRKKWDDREEELRQRQDKYDEIVVVNDKNKEKIAALDKKKMK